MKRNAHLDAMFAVRPAASGPDPDPLGAPNKPQATPAPPPLGAPNKPPSPRIRSGALAAMGSALEHLASRAQVAEQIETGAAVVELDPALIDGSFVVDRLSDTTDPSLAALVESVRESGQQIPILVRPHPSAEGRYQIAFGHRRTRAAAALGRTVRALVRRLTDAELVVAQGKENLDRRDLSYIERAFFALRLEKLDFPRETICAAMATDKADVSRYIALAKAVPEEIAAAVGPAPKAGRARWQMLSERLSSARAGKLAGVLNDAAFRSAKTDERFISLLTALAPKAEPSTEQRATWSDADGRKLARVDETADRFLLAIDRKLEPDFGTYLLKRLPEILADFKASQE